MTRPPIDFNGLDSAVHGPVRLGILTALLIDGPLDLTTLRTRLGVADGVLGLHAQKLEEAGYVAATRAFIGRRPRTTYEATPAGRRALDGYLAAMRTLVEAVEAARTTPPEAPG